MTKLAINDEKLIKKCYVMIEKWPFYTYLNDIFINKKDLDLYKKFWDNPKNDWGRGEKSITIFKGIIQDENYIPKNRKILFIVLPKLISSINKKTIKIFVHKKNAILALKSNKDLIFMRRKIFNQESIKKWWIKHYAEISD